MDGNFKHPSLAEAIAFVRKAHEGQVDKQGVDYWQHPVEVYDRVARFFPQAPPDVLMAALLHDVIEDTEYDYDDLYRLGFTKRTLAIVDLVTRVKPTTRGEYFQRLLDSRDIGALMVKYADISHNTDPARGDHPSESMQKLYEEKKEQIRAAIAAFGVFII